MFRFTFTVRCPEVMEAARMVSAALDRLRKEVAKEGRIMSQELQELMDEVAAVASVEKSAVTLIEGIVAKLAAAADDPAKVKELTAQLKAATEPLAAAISANTAS